MYQGYKISFIAPCLNEEEGVKKILFQMPVFVDEVLIVDNGSVDNTAIIAQSMGARVIKEKIRGYGSAYLTGFKNASGDIIITMDGDGSYNIGEVEKLIKILILYNYDFISGCRFPLKNKQAMRCLNQSGNYFLTGFFILATFNFIKDSQSGMWIFRREILKKMELHSLGMPLSEEIKMEAVLDKTIKFKEIQIDYQERIGNTKLSKWKDGLMNFLFLFRKRLEIFMR